ncbi:MAG: hypothetical protein J5693_00790 [Bacteroidales bacterium]|nr:hypothetical protein [Bacteroidales bacterium]
MKRTLILISAIVALCAFSSCNKESDHQLEGLWGFISEEYEECTAAGEVVDRGKFTYNPDNPSSPRDEKIEFTWLRDNETGSEYSAKYCMWNMIDNVWEYLAGDASVSIQDGNRLFESYEGLTHEVGTISFKGDLFIVEGDEKHLSPLDGEGGGYRHFKQTFKRMN